MSPKQQEVRMSSSKERSETRWLNTASLVILASFALAATLVYTQKVLVPFVLALFVVSMVSPIQDLLVLKLRFPRPLGVLACLLVTLVFMILIGVLFSNAINTVVSTVVSSTQAEPPRSSTAKEPEPEPVALTVDVDEDGEPIVDKETEKAFQKAVYNQIYALLEPPLNWLNERYPKLVNAEVAEQIITQAEKLSKELGRRAVIFLGSAVGSMFSLLASGLFVMIITVFLLSGRNPRRINRGVAADVDHKIRRYIVTKVAVSAVTGLLVWFSLKMIGLELASVFGILAFMLNFIPSIGSIISTFLPIPMAIIQFKMDIFPTSLVLLIPGSIQMLMGNVLEPKLMGEGLNLHPVTVLLALAFWGLLWGAVGMFLAAPMTAVIRIVFMQFEMLQPMGDLMAGKLPDSMQQDRQEKKVTKVT